MDETHLGHALLPGFRHGTAPVSHDRPRFPGCHLSRDQGTDPSDVQVDVSIDGGTPETILNSAVINPEGNTITITLTPSMIEYIPGSSLQAAITITVDCADAPIIVVGFYSED